MPRKPKPLPDYFTAEKDDSFREDRQVLQHHQSGAVLSLLSNWALALLRGE